jgi:collagenase-like PrtC family protease
MGASATSARVASLKIEGRLKSVHYVAVTAPDAPSERFRLAPQQRADMEQTFSRGFSHGFSPA